MKKILFLAALSLVIFSCKSTSATDTKLDKGAQVAMKGNWVISSVTYPGSEVIKVNSFQLADSKCFEGSTWKFISNNNKGEMALTSYNCPAFSSPITWFVNKDGQFVLKVLDAGEKAKKVRDGYILYVANQSQDNFQLIDKINVGGKMTDVVYQFQRAN
ncbi:lipocalin family protein [Flavobacterium sp. F-380]|uniref:Lipocalin family protein n=1 Tax=Flavobacterium kayseriense TaxID=2764714 RepID=A0ABR7J7E5_9FLAO|nr:lipocalin family protein [Flavobacterium kayseriense]MBC5841367.1 lipocalin family protein [Flavobacterium kayseriense]MBC5847895.1 lipocalin family protein [Flavobacterium kayseriense]MBU0940718.1 lipocalin family protein [Bacteroidota bacterium]